MRILMGLIMLLSMNFPVYAITTYVEGQYNNIDPDTVSTKTYSGALSGYTFNNFRGTLDHESDSVFGFEVGLSNLQIPNLRIGYSYIKPHIKLSSSTISGSVTDGTTTYSGAVTVTPAEWNSFGLIWDNDVELQMVNFYYDFQYNEKIKPFLGLGIGFADIQNTDGSELSTSLTGGAKYYLNNNTYVGGKIAWTTIDGPTDKVFGIKYNDIEILTTALLLGYEF